MKKEIILSKIEGFAVKTEPVVESTELSLLIGRTLQGLSSSRYSGQLIDRFNKGRILDQVSSVESSFYVMKKRPVKIDEIIDFAKEGEFYREFSAAEAYMVIGKLLESNFPYKHLKLFLKKDELVHIDNACKELDVDIDTGDNIPIMYSFNPEGPVRATSIYVTRLGQFVTDEFLFAF